MTRIFTYLETAPFWVWAVIGTALGFASATLTFTQALAEWRVI